MSTTPEQPVAAPAHPPLSRPTGGPRADATERVLAGLVAIGCLAILIVAAWLRPDPSGMGTHRQLGLPDCGWKLATGYPCPTCGMTTAFAHAAGGDLWASAQTQPMGMVLAVLTSAGFWVSLHVALTGSRVGLLAGRLVRPRWLIVAGVLGLASWGYAVARVRWGW
jgi:hypothetical protein